MHWRIIAVLRKLGISNPPIDIPKADQPLLPQKTLACVAMAKNEGAYLREWIDFHHARGVEYFVIYNNDSTDDTVDILEEYQSKGILRYFDWPNFVAIEGTNGQRLAYAHAVALLRGTFRWTAFLDVDEFLFPPEESDLREVLEDYADVPALGVYVFKFGTCGHKTKPPGGVIENFMWRQSVGTSAGGLTQTMVKSIVQPAHVSGVVSAHYFRTSIWPALALDEARRPVSKGHLQRVASDRLRINHYFTKSSEEFEAKLNRGYTGLGINAEKRTGKTRHARWIDANSVEDRTILKFVR